MLTVKFVKWLRRCLFIQIFGSGCVYLIEIITDLSRMMMVIDTLLMKQKLSFILSVSVSCSNDESSLKYF